MARTQKLALAITSACGPQLALSKRAPWASTTPRSPVPYRSARITPPSAVGNESSLGAAASPVNMRAASASFRMTECALLARSGIEIRHPETAIRRSAVSLLGIDDLAVRSHFGRAAMCNGRIDHAGFKTVTAAGERLRRSD